MVGAYQMVKKIYDSLSRFVTIPACDTYIQTDRQTHTHAHGNSPTYCVARAKTRSLFGWLFANCLHYLNFGKFPEMSVKY